MDIITWLNYSNMIFLIVFLPKSTEYREESFLNSGMKYIVEIVSPFWFLISSQEKSSLVWVITVLGMISTHRLLSFPYSISIVFGP